MKGILIVIPKTDTGPIVRIAPKELYITDIDYWSILYTLGTKLDKAPYMINIFGTKLAGRSFNWKDSV